MDTASWMPAKLCKLHIWSTCMRPRVTRNPGYLVTIAAVLLLSFLELTAIGLLWVWFVCLSTESASSMFQVSVDLYGGWGCVLMSCGVKKPALFCTMECLSENLILLNSFLLKIGSCAFYITKFCSGKFSLKPPTAQQTESRKGKHKRGESLKADEGEEREVR